MMPRIGDIVSAQGRRYLCVEAEEGFIPLIGLQRLHGKGKPYQLGESYWSGCSPDEIKSARPAKPGEVINFDGELFEQAQGSAIVWAPAKCPNCGGPDGYPSAHAVGCPEWAR